MREPSDDEMARYALKCVTHHEACHCREWRFHKMERQLEKQEAQIKVLRQMLLARGATEATIQERFADANN